MRVVMDKGESRSVLSISKVLKAGLVLRAGLLDWRARVGVLIEVLEVGIA